MIDALIGGKLYGVHGMRILQELENFPDGGHDDQADAAADPLDELTASAYPRQSV